tara:strand:+ start:31090 stop:31398 length:309 start_codon:yes stop_codon:yes gene_type:complete
VNIKQKFYKGLREFNSKMTNYALRSIDTIIPPLAGGSGSGDGPNAPFKHLIPRYIKLIHNHDPFSAKAVATYKGLVARHPGIRDYLDRAIISRNNILSGELK